MGKPKKKSPRKTFDRRKKKAVRKIDLLALGEAWFSPGELLHRHVQPVVQALPLREALRGYWHRAKHESETVGAFLPKIGVDADGGDAGGAPTL